MNTFQFKKTVQAGHIFVIKLLTMFYLLSCYSFVSA